MRSSQTFLFLLSLFTAIHALALPASFESFTESAKELYKRKGGGGGRGGGGSSSSSSRPGSSGSSSSGGRTGSSSSTSGGTSSGSSVRPTYGGGRYYGGGSSTAYRSGSSRGGVTPYIAGGAALGAFGGFWLYGAYAYNYPHYYYYHNDTSNQNETHPVTCLCGEQADCGCDPSNNDTDYVNAVANNASIAQVVNLNDTDTLVINGTLPAGTAETDGSGAAGLHVPQSAGIWVVIAGVTYALNYL